MATTIIKSRDSNNQAIVNTDGRLMIAGEVTAVNNSVGDTGSPPPSGATQIGAVNSGGDLVPLLVDNTGALVVSSSGGFVTQDLKILFNETNSIAIGSETTINTYTAPLGKIAYLLTILNSGENRAEYRVYYISDLLDKQYTNVTQLTAPFDYKTGASSVPGMIIAEGETIEVSVINSGASIANFNSRLMILEVTL